MTGFRGLFISTLLALLFCFSSAYALEAPNLLRNEQFAQGLESWFLKGADRCKSEVTVTSQEKFPRALRLDVTPQAKDMPWSVVLRQTIGAPLQQGRQLIIKVWLRSPERMQVTAFVENAQAPYTKSLTNSFTLTPEWKEYEIKGECKENIAPGGANCGFFLSHGKGNIRIAHVRLYQTDRQNEAPKTEQPKIEQPKIEPPKTEATKIETKPVTPTKTRQIVEPLLEDEDFERQLEGWTLPEDGTLKAEVVAATPDELPKQWTKVLKVSSQLPFEPGFYQQRTFTQKIVLAIEKGDGLQLKFWARAPQANASQANAPQASKLYVSARSAATPNALLNVALDVTPKWKAYDLRSIARNNVNDAHGRLNFVSGAVNGPLEIAGLQMERHTGVDPEWVVPPPVFNHENLLDNGDFTDNAPKKNGNGPVKYFGKWTVFTMACQPEIVAAETPLYKSALRLNPLLDAPRPMPIRIEQDVDTPPLLAVDGLVLRFWARSTMGARIDCNISRHYLEPQNVNSFIRKTAASAREAIVLSADWKEYEVPMVNKQHLPNAPETTRMAALLFTIYPAPQSAVEITGIRLAVEMAPR